MIYFQIYSQLKRYVYKNMLYLETAIMKGPCLQIHLQRWAYPFVLYMRFLETVQQCHVRLWNNKSADFVEIRLCSSETYSQSCKWKETYIATNMCTSTLRILVLFNGTI